MQYTCSFTALYALCTQHSNLKALIEYAILQVGISQ